LEGASYAVGVCDLCAAGFGAPHIRQRLYFVGSSLDYAANSRYDSARKCERRSSLLASRFEQSGIAGSLEYAEGKQMGFPGRSRQPRKAGERGGMADNNNTGLSERISERRVQQKALGSSEGKATQCCGLVNGFWSDAEWIPCIDGKSRPIEPGSSPLATGITNRVGKLRGYGNALCAPVAQSFIEAYLETENHA
jgi:DNA (cytosine-5)-methyltransferase 1